MHHAVADTNTAIQSAVLAKPKKDRSRDQRNEAETSAERYSMGSKMENEKDEWLKHEDTEEGKSWMKLSPRAD